MQKNASLSLKLFFNDHRADNKPVQMVIVACYKSLTQILKSLNIF
jgi:hypothetical protein